jgi:hypothetical protein
MGIKATARADIPRTGLPFAPAAAGIFRAGGGRQTKFIIKIMQLTDGKLSRDCFYIYADLIFI